MCSYVSKRRRNRHRVRADPPIHPAGGRRGALRRARDAIGPPVRLGAGRTRLCAYAAARRARPRRAPVVVPHAMTRAFLAPLPVGLLRERLDDEWGRADIPDKLERLGVENL